jgi:hypothetical protein
MERHHPWWHREACSRKKRQRLPVSSLRSPSAKANLFLAFGERKLLACSRKKRQRLPVWRPAFH